MDSICTGSFAVVDEVFGDDPCEPALSGHAWVVPCVPLEPLVLLEGVTAAATVPLKTCASSRHHRRRPARDGPT